MQFPGMNFDLPAPGLQDNTSLQAGYPTPRTGQESVETSNGIDLEQDIFANAGLPSDDVLIELVDIFFERLYYMFPCFHKATFMTQLRNHEIQTHAPLLLYAICCLASTYHPDPSIKNRQNDWYEQAKFTYELTNRRPHPALRTIQAVLCLVVHAFTIGDFSASWLFLGKAWRQAVAHSMHRMDSYPAMMMGIHVDHEKFYDLEREGGKTAVEKEEYRRTLWLLFMWDRNSSWPTAWPFAIDERQFKVDIPVANSIFQDMTSETEIGAVKNTAFTTNLKSLNASSSSAKEPLNLFHYIAIAHVLLGRVAELIHSLHLTPNSPEYAEQNDELDVCIVKFRLSLPRTATSVLDAAAEDRGHVIWLNLTLNTMTILLHYRCASFVDRPTANECFTRAIIAARNTVQIIKDAAQTSIDLLLNAHIGSSLYVAACVLVIQWRITGDESFESDIELFTLLFERMTDMYKFLGMKFKLGLEHDVKRSKESVVDLKDRGFRGLMADCSKWRHVQEEVAKIGLTVT